MFTQQLTDQMLQFINDLKVERRRKKAANAKSRAINCMELEDRILLSASPIAPETLVNKNTAEVQQTATHSTQSVASDAQGNHVVVWSNLNQNGSGWDVYAQRFNAAGVAQGNQFQVNTHTEHDQKEAQVSMRDDGTFVITWTDSDSSENGSADIYVRSYNADGTPTKNEETLVTAIDNGDSSPGDQKYSAVTINNNGVFVSWTSQNSDGKWDLFGRWFDTQGNALKPEFQINSTSSSDAILSQVGMDPRGFVMVVWQSENAGGNRDIYGRYAGFCNGDSRDTGEYRLNAITEGNQYNPHLGFKSNDGSFLVSWTADNSDGGSDIYARQFDSNGSPINGAPEFRVNTTTGIAHDNSSVTVDDTTGNFLVTWSSYNQDAFGGWGVYSRGYNADGTPATPETQVNTTIAGSQNYSSATFLNANSYVITWSGNGTGDDSGVFSQFVHDGFWGTYANDRSAGNPTFNNADIGSPGQAGSTAFNGRTWTVQGGGAGIGSTSDQFDFASQDFAENGDIFAKITSISSSPGEAGIMFRNDTGANAAYAGVFLQGNTLGFQWRETAGAQSASVSVADIKGPVWVHLSRSGNQFSGFYSYDDITWIRIGDSKTVDMNPIVKAGLAVTAGDNGAIATAAFQNVSVFDPRNFVLAGRDIGAQNQAGSTSFANGVYTVVGGGSGIGGSTDKFQFGANGLAGDWDLTSQILDADAGATAGIMIRNGDSADAKFAGILRGPDNTLNFTWRNSDGSVAGSVSGPALAGPVWVKLSRVGDYFTGWYSANGTQWTQIGAAQSIAMSQSVLGGLVVASNDNGVSRHASFANVAVSRAVVFAGTPTDVGTPDRNGTSYHTNGDSYVISGSGSGIGGDTDEFHFSSNAFIGDGMFIAQVALPSGAGAGAEAGVMFRNDGSLANSPFADVVLTSAGQVKFAWRNDSGTGSEIIALNGFQAGDPIWVKLTRSHGNFSGCYSADGVNWTQIGGSKSIAMNDSIQAGLAVCSGNGATQVAAIYHRVAISQTSDFSWNGTDIGNPNRTGNSWQDDGGTYQVSGGILDNQGPADQYHFSSVSFQQGSISAEITAWTDVRNGDKAGVMFRNDTAIDSAFASVVISANHTVNFEWRDGSGSGSASIPIDALDATHPVWVKLDRSGSQFRGYYSLDGNTWLRIGETQSLEMDAAVQAGLAVTAHTGATALNATFNYVSITQNADIGLSGADIGGPVLAGSTSYDNGVYTVNGGGNDISGTADKFQFASKTLSGDGEIVARIDSMSLDTCDWALSGVMIRENDTPGSLYAIVAGSPATSLQFQWRSRADDGVGYAFHDYTYSGHDFSTPVWVKLVRQGNAFSAYFSDNGTAWTQIGDTQVIGMSGTVKAGLAVAGNNDTLLDSTKFSNVSIAQKSNFALTDSDIGTPTVAGSTAAPEEAYVVSGGGADVYANNQQFYFSSQDHVGDGDVIARVDSQTAGGYWVMSGVMYRNNSAPNDTNAPFAAVFADKTFGGLVFQWSNANGLNSACYRVNVPDVIPTWVKLSRVGNDFSGYYSTDGTNWVQIGNSVAIGISETARAGLFVCAYNNDVASSAKFSNVSISQASNFSWIDTDVGGPTAAGPGSSEYPDAGYLVFGGGFDIGVWNGNDGAVRDDQYQFSSERLSGDLTMIARIASFSEANVWSKAGIMFRDSTEGNSMFAAVIATPSNGIQFQWRTSDGAAPLTSGPGISVGEPVWVKLVRNGDQFSGYYSIDKVTWIQIGTSQSVAMSETIRGGLAVCGGNTGAFANAAFDNVSVTENRNSGATNLANAVFEQAVSQVDMNWGNEGSPGTGIGGTNWSASWQGKILADTSGTYSFRIGGDDGIRLWINGNLLVDYWNDEGFDRTDASYHYATINLNANQWNSIRIDYYQGWGGEAVQLQWAPPGQTWTTVPASHVSYDNVPPINRTPAPQMAVENTPLVFSAALGNAIQVSDADACYGPLEVTLALTPGTGSLTLAHTEGLQFVSGDGTGDASMTFIGSLDSINAALDGLTYAPGTGYTGQVSLQITTNDMAPAFAGGSKSDADTVAITVAGNQGFLATYYNNPDFTGTTVQTVDPQIDFVWNGSPVAGIDADAWSARWTGWISAPETGNYVFHASTDNGCRLWINNVLVINNQNDSNPIALTAGQLYSVRMEYQQNGTGGRAALEWSSDNLSRELISSDRVRHDDQAPVNDMPGDQAATINTPLTFSTANGNAIVVSNPNADSQGLTLAIGDAGFENTVLGAGNHQTGGSNGNWHFTDFSTSNNGTPNASGVVANGSGYGNPNATEGSQAAFIQGNGSIWQDVNFTDSGNYAISFMAAARGTYAGNPIRVQIDGVDAGVFTPTSTAYQGFRINPIWVPAGVHRVTLVGTTDGALDRMTFVDRVSIVKAESLVQVTLSVDPGQGLLSIGSLNGLTFSQGDGGNDQTMTFSGSLEDVNAAMDGMQYIPVANATGTANLHLTSSSLMSPLPGGPKSATSSISVIVSNVTDHTGLLATYYNWDSSAGPVCRIDPTVDIDWNANGSPAPGIVGNNWNVSWEGKVLADYNETYTFHATADDGVRLWVNGSLLVDAANNQALNAFTGTINLQSGHWYSIRMEYYQKTAGGTAKLEWSSASQLQETIPAGHLSCGDLLAQENVAPLNNVPGPQAANLNTPMVFSTANGNPISISSPEIDASTASVPVADSSFETVNIGTGYYSNQYNPTGSDWTFEGTSGIAANGSGMLDYRQTGGEDLRSPNGTQVAFLERTGSMWQNVAFAEAGEYTISFKAAYRTTGDANPFLVQVDGVTVAKITPNSPSYTGYSTNSFNVTAGTHRIAFVGLNSTGDTAAFIDQVSIAKTSSLVQVTLALVPGEGTLKMQCTDGLTFQNGSRNYNSTMTFSGTLADVNAALNGLEYMPAADFTGTANLSVTSTHAGTIFNGGSKFHTDSIPLYVSVPSDTSGLLGLFYNGPDGATIDTTNLAYGKTVTSSSVYPGYALSNLVDGDENTIAHTLNGGNQWMQIDLSPGTNIELTQIKIFNRAEGCGDRLQHFTVSVIAHDGTVVWSQTYDQPTTDGEVLTFNTGEISGEFVKIQKNDANFLNLKEVQVFNLGVPDPTISRVDPTVNFNWGNQGSPAPGIPGNNWSASWQGKILANYSEDYTFHVTADDGVRLWVNNQLLIDSWHAQDSTTHTGTIRLQAGQWYSIRLDYYQISGNSGVQLEWSSASQTRQIVPTSQLSHENSAPVNSVPGPQTTDENTPIVFSTANNNAIQISDIDDIYGPLQVTLSVNHGTITVNNRYNLTFTTGDGVSDSTMTFTGLLADINAALNGLTYTPETSGNYGYISSAALQIATNDLAPALAGGAKISTSTVNININAPGQYNGLLATYYDNIDFSGNPQQRIDSNINFDWGSANSSPMSGIPANNWSARWLGTITADHSETYTFYATGDDGFRLYVNDQLLIDRSNNHTNTLTYSGTIDLVAGQAYSLRLDYTQVGGEASMKVEWSSASQSRQVIPADHFHAADRTPAIAVPDAQNGIAAQPIVFSPEHGNAIAIAELHNNGNPLTVTIAASSGSLTLNGTAGLTFSQGDGASDATMTFSGDIADINAALTGLIYSRSNGESGPATLEITALDTNPSTGSRSSTATVQIGAVQSQQAGLLATFYSDTNLGTGVTSRIDSTINFDWGNQGSPAPGVAGANWSATWSGYIQVPESGLYAFYTTTDDGVRLSINDKLLIDEWHPQSPTTHSNSIYLEAGKKYSIRMDYNQFGAGEMAKLEWSSDNIAQQVIPAGQFTHATQAPLVYLPAAQNVDGNSSLTFTTSLGNAISILDLDAQTSLMQVTLSAVNGTFTLGGNQGLTFVSGDGLNDALVAFTGNLADINAALDGLCFNPTTGYHGPASLRIEATDLTTSLSAGDSLAVTVLAVNRPPVNIVPGPQSVNENQSLAFSAANGNALRVSDADIDPATSSIAVRDAGFESPSLGTGATAYQYAVYGSDWTFVGTSGIAANGSAFANADSPAGTQAAFIQNGGTISQDIAFAETGNYTIAFAAAYRPNYWGSNPIQVEVDGVKVGLIAPTSTSFQYYRTNSFAATAGSHRVTFRGMNPGGDRTTFLDRVSIDKASSLVQVSLSADIGKITLGTANGLVFSQGTGIDSASMTFTGTLSDVNAALDGLQYVPLHGYKGSALLTITTNDLGNTGAGGAKSATNTVSVNVLAVNSPPVNAIPGSQGTYVNHSIVFSESNRNPIHVSDSDIDPNIQRALFADGSFESVNVGTGYWGFNQTGVIGSAWTFSPGFSLDGTYHCGGVAGAGSAYEHPTAPDGGQVAFVQGNGSFYQDVVFTQSGNYAISFQSAYRNYGGQHAFAVQIDGVDVGIFNPNSTDFQAYSTSPIAVTAGIHRVTFQGIATPGDHTAFIDQVAIALVSDSANQLQVTLAVEHGALFLGQTRGLTFLSGDGSDDASMTFRGTMADINAALDGLRYAPSNDFVGSDSLRIATNDLGNSGFGGPMETVNTVKINVAGGPVVNSTLDGNQQTFPESPQAVAANANGDYVVVWSSQNQDGDGWGVYARRFNAAGIAQGNEFQVNTRTAGDQMYAAVAMNADGNFVITWSSRNSDGGWCILGQRYDAAGNAVGSEFQVNAASASDQMYSSVAIDAGGDFAVTWSKKNLDTGDWDVFARVFQANGAESNAFQVNADSTGDQMYSRIAMNGGGAFVIVWQSKSPNGDWNVFARQYGIDGHALANELRVNATTTGNRQNADIGMNAAGEFVVSWTAVEQDGGKRIFAQRFDANGAPLGSEFQASASAYQNQDYSSVAVDRRGNFFITWSSFGQDTPGMWSVYGQRYNADGTALGTETRINATTDGSQAYSSIASLSPNDYLAVWSGKAPGDDSGVFQAEQCPPGLIASYFGSTNFSGTPVRRIDPSIDFDYGYQSFPSLPGLTRESWSARWEGLIKADTSETYTFYANTAGSTKLWINGEQVIDSGDSGTFTFVAGQWYSIRMDYYQSGGIKNPNLQWSSASVARQLVSSSHFTFENPAPVNNLPVSSSVNENQQLILSTTNNNALQISDLDVADDNLQVTLSVTHGTISLSGSAGLTFLDGAGADVAAMTFRGTLGDINAALDGLRFRPDEYYRGMAELQVVTDDLGSTGVGGAKTTATTMAINVIAVNQAPFNVLPGSQSVLEHDTVVFSAAKGNAIQVGDRDAFNSPIQVTLSVDHGALTLGNFKGLTFLDAAGINAPSITMTGTIGDINAALDGLQFRPEDNFNGTANLRIVTNDLGNSGIGGPLTAAGSVAIDVTAVNDPPSIIARPVETAYTQFPKTFSEQTGNAIRIEDPDAFNSPLSVTLAVDQGTLTLGNFEGLTFLSGVGTNSTRMVFQGTLADINAALDGMQFKANDGFEGTARIQVLVDDLGNTGIGGAKNDSQTITINVVHHNEPPVNTVPGPQEVLEHQTITFDSLLNNGVRISDSDSGVNDSVLVTLTADHGTIRLGRTDGLTFLSGNGNGNGSMSFTGTIANINRALEGMQFTPVDNYDGPAGLRIVTNDLGNRGAGGPLTAADAIDIHVTSVNDPPTIDAPGRQDAFEHQTIVFSQANGNAIVVGDPDAGDAPVRVTLATEKGSIALSGVQGLTFDPGSGPSGRIVSFMGSIADINRALEGMTFVSSNLVDSTTAALQITVNDLGHSGAIGGPQTTSRTMALGITAVNDPPTISLPSNLGIDPTKIIFSRNGGNPILIGDPDAGDNPVMLTIMTSDGSFTLGSTAGLNILAGTPVQSPFIMLYGTIDNINHALDGMVFKTTSSFAAMQMKVNDLGQNQGLGGPQETTKTLYVRPMVDPNFQPGECSVHFQQHTGVFTQPGVTTTQYLLHDTQLQAKLPSLDKDQIGAFSFKSNASQLTNAHLVDAGSGNSASERLLNRGTAKNSEDTLDVRDAKLIEETKFSADTQNIAEPVDVGASLRQNENLLVGLGIVSAGYLAWAFNGGSLLAGAISATPMWKPFDPLAVLDFTDRAAGAGEGLGEDNLQSLFG